MLEYFNSKSEPKLRLEITKVKLEHKLLLNSEPCSGFDMCFIFKICFQ